VIFILDNYDSFTYNLVQYVGEMGEEPLVRRNDRVSLDDIQSMKPGGIIISPGPGRPADAGVSVALVRTMADRVPILGVCLGHQAIGEALGGRIVAADRLMHGKTSEVAHVGSGVFSGLPSPFVAMRYHSLIVERASLPPDLSVTAWTADRDPEQEIMGLEHRTLPLYGVQFHPESVRTTEGKQLVRNFLEIVRRSR
jgi:anthranilate synthase component II